MKNLTLVISFGNSTSKFFDDATRLVKQLDGNGPDDEGRYTMSSVLEPGSKLEMVVELFSLVNRWKSTDFRVNGRASKRQRVSELLESASLVEPPNVPANWTTEVDWRAWGKPFGLNREKYRDQQMLKEVVGPGYDPGFYYPVDFVISYEKLPSSAKHELVVRAKERIVGTIPTRYTSGTVAAIKSLELGPYRVPGVIRSGPDGVLNFYIWPGKLLDTGVSLWHFDSSSENAVVGPDYCNKPDEDVVLTYRLSPEGRLTIADCNVPNDWKHTSAWQGWERPADIIAGAMYYTENLENLMGPSRLGGYFTPVDVEFRRDPLNQHDQYAIEIKVHEKLLGYVSRHQAARISPYLDKKGMSTFKVAGVLRGDPPRVACEIWLGRRLTRGIELSEVINVQEFQQRQWPPLPGDAGHFIEKVAPLSSRQVRAPNPTQTKQPENNPGCLAGLLSLFGLA